MYVIENFEIVNDTDRFSKLFKNINFNCGVEID